MPQFANRWEFPFFIQMDSVVNKNRRRFLTVAATVVGGAGAVAASVPFLSMMTPSARTKLVGGPVKISLSGLNDGDIKVVQWRGNPVWVVRRGPRVLDDLGSASASDGLKDPESKIDAGEGKLPEYAQNQLRSRKPEYLILLAVCTHLGCSPKYITPNERHNKLPPDAVGGIVCNCHGSSFDLAGRVYSGSPASSNLIVPKHYFVDDSTLVIGEDGIGTGGAA